MAHLLGPFLALSVSTHFLPLHTPLKLSAQEGLPGDLV